jgi:DNA-binding transcriptional LysR family regulator
MLHAMKTYDLNLLLTLDALLSTGSVTAAAARMHLSTPAMSHALARAREVFGDPILVRAGRKLVPTPRAAALAEPVRELLRQAHALRDETPQDITQVQRRFVLRAPEGWAVVYGATLLQALQARMPLASLQMLPEAHHDPEALREGRIDADIGGGRRLDAQLRSLVLSRQPMVGAARAGHPVLGTARTPRRVPVNRLAAAQHVDVTRRADEPSPVDRALAEQGLQRDVRLWVPSTFTALIAASRSDLVACAPERTARAMAGPLGLVVFKLPFDVHTEPTRLAWHPRHDADPAHAWLRECLGQVFQGGYHVADVASAAVAHKGMRQPLR